MTDIVERLRERLALRYMGDCKCGKCQLVPGEDVAQAADEIERLREALRDFHHVLHKLMGIVPGNDTAVHEMAEAMKKARAALGEGKE